MIVRIGRSLVLAAFLAAIGVDALAQSTTSYTFDPQGRLVSSQSTNGSSITYVYDNADNRTRLTMSNGGPAAVNDSASTWSNTPTTISVLANDSSPKAYGLIVTAATPGTHGTTTINSGSTITYTPTAGYAGLDAISYSISDGHGGTAQATVSLNVTSSVPTAADDYAQTTTGSVTVAVLANDSSPRGYTLTVTSISTPSNGAIAKINNGTTITVNVSTTASTDFTYNISDGHGGTASANVHVDNLNCTLC